MDIILRPDSLSFTGNINHFVIAANKEISFVLRLEQGDSIVVQHAYTPNKKNMVDIDVEKIVAPLLTFILKEEKEPYKQELIARSFKVEIAEKDDQENKFVYTFRVMRAGVDHLADSPTNFLKENFLTWQPSIKPVTYYTPEFLTYYATEDVVAKCQAFVDNNGQYGTTDLLLANLPKDSVWTIPVQYAIIAEKIKKMPSFYDVWIESTMGVRLTYKQRYYASDIKSEQEQWILFENLLGGVDTFRAYGDAENTAKHTHNIAEIENDALEYRVDTAREFKKNTGLLSKQERQWLLDFFPSLGKYIYVNAYIRRIVVTESNVNYEVKKLPSSYSFTYKYADARPYLNLPRTPLSETLSELNIKVPDVGSFTIAPRLVEFQKLQLSGGALFPVQNPYAESWGVTTADAIIAFLKETITAAYKGDGAFGHTHTNISVLDALNRFGKYLLLGTEKIAAGMADKATIANNLAPKSTDWDAILRKDRNDSTSHDLTIGGNLTVHGSLGSNAFSEGIGGAGWRLWLDHMGKSHIQVDFFEAMVRAAFHELEVRRMIGISGDQMQSNAASVLIDAIPILTEGKVVAWKCHLKTDDGTTQIFNTWAAGDQAFCQTSNLRQGLTKDAANRTYWRVVADVKDKTDSEEAYIILSNETPYYDDKRTDAPQAGDSVVQFGHNAAWDLAHGIDTATTANRMNVIMQTTSGGSPVNAGYRAIYSFNYSIADNAVFYLSAGQVLLRSNSLKWISESGAEVPNVLYMGDWKPGTKAHRYETYTYNGSTRICLMDTTDEPNDQSAAWGIYAAKGGSGLRVEGFSSAGSAAFTEGQTDWRATFELHVWENDIETTDTLPTTRFRWTRVSEYSAGDTAWNGAHENIGNTLSVTYDDLKGDTSFICAFLSADGNDVLASRTF